MREWLGSSGFRRRARSRCRTAADPAPRFQLEDGELDVGIPVARSAFDRPAKGFARPLAVAETPREDSGDDVGLAAEDVEPARALEPVERQGRDPPSNLPTAASTFRAASQGSAYEIDAATRPAARDGQDRPRRPSSAARSRRARPATGLPQAPARRRPGRRAPGSPRTSRSIRGRTSTRTRRDLRRRGPRGSHRSCGSGERPPRRRRGTRRRAPSRRARSARGASTRCCADRAAPRDRAARGRSRPRSCRPPLPGSAGARTRERRRATGRSGRSRARR